MVRPSIHGMIGAIAAIALMLAACGDAVDLRIETEEDGQGASIEIDTPGANIDISSGVVVPDGFPVPDAPGCRVTSSSSVETADTVVATVTLDFPVSEAEEVAAFYEREFEELGLEVSRTTTEAVGAQTIIVAGIDPDDDDHAANLFMDVSNGAATVAIAMGRSS